MIKLKALPETGEFIELPNVAELMMYPQYLDLDLDTAYKIGTDFQKHLIDQIPLRHSRKNLSALFQVRLLAPDMRSCTQFNGDETKEWHIDSEVNADEDNHLDVRNFEQETDIVHLLYNECTSPTQFLGEEINVNVPSGSKYIDFIRKFQEDYHTYGLKTWEAPHSRFVTFTNHIHRATQPMRPEFKFMFRVVETDRERSPQKNYGANQSMVLGWDKTAGKMVKNLVQHDDRIEIFLPRQLTKSMIWNKEEGR